MVSLAQIAKVCPRCEGLKPLEHFYKKKDGKPQGYCKTCMNDYARERRPPTPKVLGECRLCGDPFIGSRRQIFCGERCSLIARTKNYTVGGLKQEVVCSGCRTTFTTTNKRHRWCSTRCSGRMKIVKTQYGLSPDGYWEIWDRQEGNCGGCGLPLSFEGKGHHRMTPVVDHCHTTKVVRGILHSGCNLSLGYLDESPSRLRALADYAERVCADAPARILT